MKKAAMEEVPVGDTKLCDSVNQLKTGLPADAAEDLKDRMCMQNSIAKYYGRRAKEVEGIQDEVDEFVKDPKRVEDSEAQEVGTLLSYIRYEAASEKKYENGIRDKGRHGEKLSDFLQHNNAKDAKLSEAEVVAMRLYTTVAYKFMNFPLRDNGRYERKEECPLPVTTAFALDGIKKMRQVYTKRTANGITQSKSDSNEVSILVDQKNVLWRGMRNLEVSKEFMVHGGTELAFLSTTTELKVALRYCLSKNSLLFKIVSDNFMTMGAELKWLSAFPGEAEILYPPLTYLKPTGRKQVTENAATKLVR
jgi:hypothetical protein